jgi:integrase
MKNELKTYFFLRDKDAKKKTSILCLVSLGSDRKKLSTGISIAPAFWDAKKERAIEGEEVNESLTKIEKEFSDYNYSVRMGKCQAIIDDGKGLIVKATGKTEPIKNQKENPRAFKKYIQMYIEVNQNVLAHNTLKKYHSLIRFLEDGYKIEGVFYPPYSKGITIDEVNSEWAIKLRAYCLANGELNNTISKRFQIIRTVLTFAEDMKYIKDVNLKYFTHEQDSKIEAVTLTNQDIEKISKLDCTPEDANIRDMFLLLVYTGADFADIKKLNKKNLHTTNEGRKYWKFLRQKTDKKDIYSFPECTQECEDLLNKRGWKFKYISYDKSLFHLKRICEKAEINEQITLKSKSGTNVKEITKPKWDWIGFKTARRTSITSDLQDNKEAIEFTAFKHGHSKITTTQKYQHLDADKMVNQYKTKEVK